VLPSLVTPHTSNYQNVQTDCQRVIKQYRQHHQQSYVTEITFSATMAYVHKVYLCYSCVIKREALERIAYIPSIQHGRERKTFTTILLLFCASYTVGTCLASRCLASMRLIRTAMAGITEVRRWDWCRATRTGWGIHNRIGVIHQEKRQRRRSGTMLQTTRPRVRNPMR
jgi:hypothetical protein